MKIPVEVWKRNKTWTFRVNSTKEIETVTIDPENKIPDSDLKNNTWKSSEQTTAAAEKVNLQDYVGVYGSKQLPIKITLFTLMLSSLNLFNSLVVVKAI